MPTVSDSPAPSEASTPSAKPPRARLGAAILLAVAALSAGGLTTWYFAPGVGQWLRGGEVDPAEQRVEQAVARIDGLAREVESLREAQRQLERRVSDNATRQRVLSEELLGLGERAALLEEGLAQRGTVAPVAPTASSLRLDEVEVLLSVALQRLQLADDQAGALRAYRLAGDLLGALSDPRYFNLRQVLAQEEAALRAMPADPRQVALGELDALEASLTALPEALPAPGDTADGRLARLLSRLVEVRPSEQADVLAPRERALARTALGMDMAMARAAAERRDPEAFGRALGRIDTWLLALYADGPALAERRARLAALRGQPLALDLPVLGSTLDQLRQIRGGQAGAEPGA